MADEARRKSGSNSPHANDYGMDTDNEDWDADEIDMFEAQRAARR